MRLPENSLPLPRNAQKENRNDFTQLWRIVLTPNQNLFNLARIFLDFVWRSFLEEIKAAKLEYARNFELKIFLNV